VHPIVNIDRYPAILWRKDSPSAKLTTIQGEPLLNCKPRAIQLFLNFRITRYT
jgi:hypothetical protein